MHEGKSSLEGLPREAFAATGCQKVRKLPNTVKIPTSLTEKLKPFGPRFIKVVWPVPGDPKSGKAACEHAWQEHLYSVDDPELQAWLKAGGNYGIAFGEGIAGVDLDNKDIRQKFEEKVNTFTVKSGRISGDGRHAYIRTDASENATILHDDGKNLGSIQVYHKYVVGPGCIHNSGGRYEIIKDVPLAWVSKKTLEEIFGGKLKWAGESRRENEEESREEKDLIDFEIPIAEVIPNFKDLRKISNDEYQGEHPIHGSTTGQNFCVSISKNCWHCFRCNSGGGPLSWLAVKYGLISCDQAQKGALRGDLFLKTLELARKEGYDVALPENEETDLSGSHRTGDKKYDRVKLTQITSLHCKKPLEVHVLISGVSASYQVPLWARVKSSGCAHDGNCSLLKGISSQFLVDDQVKFIERGEASQRMESAKILVGRKCPEKLQCLERNCCSFAVSLRMGTLTECFAMDAVDELRLDEKSMAPRIVKIYVAKEPPQSGSVVVCQGTVGALPRTSQLVFIAENLTEAQKDIDTFDLEKAKPFLSPTTMEEQVRLLQNATGAVGREDLLQAILLAYCSPLYVTWKNVTVPGWLITEIYGDTRTFKSEGAKRVRRLLSLGLYVSMETGGRTGILYTINQTKTGYIILWGELIYADRGVLIIDGANRLKGEEWIEFREARSDGLVKVRRAAKGDAWCRVRQIFIRNPESGEALKNFPFRLQAIKYQPPDIARYDLFIPVWEEHVEKIIERPPLAVDKLDETSSRLRTVVLWCQSRKPEQVEFTDEAVRAIEAQAKKFYKKYACSDFPIVSSDFDKKVAKLSASWAGATVNTDETYERIIVAKEIVEKACEWYDHVLTLNQLDEFAKIQKRMTDVSDDELKVILEDIKKEHYAVEILDTLLKEGIVRRDVLAAGLGVSEKTISESMTILKKHRLVRSKPSGYQLTPRGIIVAKKVVSVAEVAGLERPPSTSSTKNTPTYLSKRGNHNNQSNLSEENHVNLTDWSKVFPEEKDDEGKAVDE
jgi:hypothetical protein